MRKSRGGEHDPPSPSASTHGQLHRKISRVVEFSGESPVAVVRPHHQIQQHDSAGGRHQRKRSVELGDGIQRVASLTRDDMADDMDHDRLLGAMEKSLASSGSFERSHHGPSREHHQNHQMHRRGSSVRTNRLKSTFDVVPLSGSLRHQISASNSSPDENASSFRNGGASRPAGSPTAHENMLFPTEDLARRSFAIITRPTSLKQVLHQSINDPRRKRRAGPPSLRSVTFAIIMMIRMQIAIEVKRLSTARLRGGGGLLATARSSARGIAQQQHHAMETAAAAQAQAEAALAASQSASAPVTSRKSGSRFQLNSSTASPMMSSASPTGGGGGGSSTVIPPLNISQSNEPATPLQPRRAPSVMNLGASVSSGTSPAGRKGTVSPDAASLVSGGCGGSEEDEISVASTDSNDDIDDDTKTAGRGGGRQSFPDAADLENFPPVVRMHIYKIAGSIIARLFPMFRLRKARLKMAASRRAADYSAISPDMWSQSMFDGWPSSAVTAVLEKSFVQPFSHLSFVAYSREPLRYMFLLLSGSAVEIERVDPRIKSHNLRRNSRVVATYTAPCCIRDTVALVDDSFASSLLVTSTSVLVVVPVAAVEEEYVAMPQQLRDKLDPKYKAVREERVRQLLHNIFKLSISADRSATGATPIFSLSASGPDGSGGADEGATGTLRDIIPATTTLSSAVPSSSPPSAAAIPKDMCLDIRRCPLFATISPVQERMLLQRLVPKSFFQGEIIVSKDNPGDPALFFVVRGTAVGFTKYRDKGTMRWQELLFGTWSAGDNFGAKEMYFQEAPIFTTRAKANLDLVVLTRPVLHQVLSSDKQLKQDVANGALLCRATDPKVKIRLHSVRSIPCIQAALAKGLIDDQFVRKLFTLFKLRIYPAHELMASSSMAVREVIVPTTGLVVCNVNSASPFIIDRGRPLGVSLLTGMRWRYPIYATTECEAWVLDAFTFGKFCNERGVFHEMRRLSLEQYKLMGRSLNAETELLEVRSPQLLFTKPYSVKDSMQSQAERSAASAAISVLKEAPRDVPLPYYDESTATFSSTAAVKQRRPVLRAAATGGGHPLQASQISTTESNSFSSPMVVESGATVGFHPTTRVGSATSSHQSAADSHRVSVPVFVVTGSEVPKSPSTLGSLTPPRVNSPAGIFSLGSSRRETDWSAAAASTAPLPCLEADAEPAALLPCEPSSAAELVACRKLGGGVHSMAQAQKRDQQLCDFVLSKLPPRPRSSSTTYMSRLTCRKVVIPRATPRATPRLGSLEWSRESPLRTVGSLRIRSSAGTTANEGSSSVDSNRLNFSA